MSELSTEWVESKRPWKLATLSIGIGLLVAGSYLMPAPDWVVPISFIMAGFAYLFALWCLRMVLERRWRRLPLVLLLSWFTVDGCYWLYWRSNNPAALELMREANLPASLSKFGVCGVVGCIERACASCYPWNSTSM